jgi:hypothetical protein
MSWLSIDSGKTVGTHGSEDGVIIFDEEHTSGACITLEQGGRTATWAITCGIYGTFMHTAFASSEAEGRTKYSAMKPDLEGIMNEADDEKRYSKMRRFADVY